MTERIVEQRGPFKVTNREIVHDKFGMQFIKDDVIRPNGSKGQQFWVNFPNGGVLIFPLDNEGNIYLTEEFTYATDKYSIEVAGGSIDEGESPEQAALREAKEETGLEVESLGRMTPIFETTSRVNDKSHRFLAKVKSEGDAELEPAEIIRLKKVPFEKAYQMVLDGEISTAVVSDGIFRIKLFLDSLSKLGQTKQ